MSYKKECLDYELSVFEFLSYQSVGIMSYQSVGL